MKIISWNVNGINACLKKGLIEFMKKEGAESYCFQEVKATNEKIPKIDGYKGFHSIAEKKGYSGVSVYTKRTPISVIQGIGIKEIDKEGRVITLEFDDFYLINAYFPHSHRELKRMDYKLDFNNKFLIFCKNLEKTKPIVVASDFNVAHKEIDLRNPKQNEKNAGFTIEERNWFDLFLKEGFIDTFREFEKGEGHYTWWAYRQGVRERNIGWRIDYFIISKLLRGQLKDSKILNAIMGSDHCPISIELITSS